MLYTTKQPTLYLARIINIEIKDKHDEKQEKSTISILSFCYYVELKVMRLTSKQNILKLLSFINFNRLLV